MEQAKAPSIIQTIALGLNAIIARPWALLAALALDVYLWQGMELRPITFAQELRAVAGATLSGGVDETQRQGLEQAQSLITSLEGTDLQLEAPFNFVPSLFTTETLKRNTQAIFDSGGWLATIGAFILVNLVLLALSACYLAFVARAVGLQGGEQAAGRVSLPQIWWRLLRYILLLFGIALALGLPFLLITTGLLLLAPPLGAALLFLWILATILVWVFTGLGIEAIAYSGAGPLQAAHQSVNIVRRNFWPMLGLLILSIMINSGFLVIWRQLGESTPGMIVALFGSATLGGGLSAARMIFYRDRLRRWQAETKT